MLFPRRYALLILLLACMPPASRADGSIRVMTFNLRYSSAAEDQGTWKQWDSPVYSPQRREFAVRLVAQYQPDVVGFQEGLDTQLDYLAAHLPDYAFERRRPSGGGGAENAAFAFKTHAVELLGRDVLSLGPSPGGGYWNNTPGTNFNPYVFFPNMGLGFPRIALRGRFRWRATGQEFLFHTTHFDFNTDPQVGSARLIADDARVRNDRMPASPLSVVVGDFNCTQDANAWKLFTGAITNAGITGDYLDSWWQVYSNWTGSGSIHGYLGGVRPATDRIDWILHRGGVIATQTLIVADTTVTTNASNGTTATLYPSDHYPILAVLRLPPVASDYDRDGLPDALELSRPGSLPADPDSDDDGLLDGQEDLNGNGTADGGETDALSPGDRQLPTDIRNHSMNGVRDFAATLLAQNGLELHARFDGRYLYVATQDAGEGSDHFIFVCTNPAAATNAPWAKSGQVAAWIAFLADENDSGFNGWFNASRAQITNLFLARSATYFENGGRLEGVIDLGHILGPGFTNELYLAAAPYGTADSGALVTAAQVPAGNGDGNLLGAGEYIRLAPGDDDGDGINDCADPDRDGDGLNDAWAAAHSLAPGSGNSDDDEDGSPNRHEFDAGTNPRDPASAFRIREVSPTGIVWSAIWGRRYVLETSQNQSNWTGFMTNNPAASFPQSLVATPFVPATSQWVRMKLAP